MDTLTIATGVWPATVLVAVVITAIVTPLLLRAYRNATVRGMGKGDAAAMPMQRPALEAARRPPLRTLPLAAADSGTGARIWQRARRSIRRLQWIHVMAGSAYSSILSLAWMLAAGGGFPPTRFALLLVVFAWPVVLMLAHLGALGRRGWLKYLGAYFAIVVIIIGYAVLVNESLSVGDALFFWLHANLVPSALWLVVLNHRIRAVGPLVLAMAMAGTGASFGLFAVATRSDALVEGIGALGANLDLGAGTTFTLMLALPFLAGITLAVLALRALGRAYRAKRTSAQSLTVNCLLLLFAVWHPVTLVFENLTYAVAGPLAFVTYLTVRTLALRIRPGGAIEGAQRLLLLRVFALDAASRALFALWSPTWLRAGSVAMISGPDLATAAVEPHEFLAFLGGRLDREFINTDQQIDARLARYDHDPDPDGNYRSNDYFCRNNTWREVVQRLAVSSDRIVMDLRGFRTGNDGCEWELGEVLERVDLTKVVLLVNRDTDQDHLTATLERCWHSVSAESPNVKGDVANARLLAVDRLDAATARRIVSALGTV